MHGGPGPSPASDRAPLAGLTPRAPLWALGSGREGGRAEPQNDNCGDSVEDQCRRQVRAARRLRNPLSEGSSRQMRAAEAGKQSDLGGGDRQDDGGELGCR